MRGAFAGTASVLLHALSVSAVAFRRRSQPQPDGSENPNRYNSKIRIRPNPHKTNDGGHF
jgi:hypothetical protein